VDLDIREVYYGAISIEQGRIASIERLAGSRQAGPYIMPGFIDAHIHVESSMLVPSEFARLAVVHGTVATVSDPHEIANVLGVEGVEFMIDDGARVPFKFFFGAPSCVPATAFETAGARLGPEEVATLLRKPEIRYLAEMMNYPGVLAGDAAVLAKLELARSLGKPVDGHAPGLRGAEAARYIEAGISTDHECFTYEEALEKLQYGMKIIIREGSAARNFDALIDLLPHYPDCIMFCSDDKHPDDLVKGHINQLAARAVQRGMDLYQVLRAACINPIEHYGLDVGRLRVGDPADFIVVDNLQTFDVNGAYIDGCKVAAYGETLIRRRPTETVNCFAATPKQPADFRVRVQGASIQVIQAIEGEIVTGAFTAPVAEEDGWAVADPQRDILKIAVVNRYRAAPPAVAFIQGFNLKTGAIASSVAHDSHNIIAVGVEEEALCRAVNLIVESKGGIAAVYEDRNFHLALPVAGLMGDRDGYEIANAYGDLNAVVVADMGCNLSAPFMALSFMALLVIPELKLSDQGLFDGKAFTLTEPFPV